MKNFTNICIIILIFSQVLQAQVLDKKTIDRKYQLKNDAFYVLNGRSYEQKDSLTLDLTLKSFPINYVVGYTKLIGGTIGCGTNDILMIQVKKQHNKEIREKLKKVKNTFLPNITGNSKSPILILNQKIIDYKEAENIILGLKVRRIFFINSNSETVVIWTK